MVWRRVGGVEVYFFDMDSSPDTPLITRRIRVDRDVSSSALNRLSIKGKKWIQPRLPPRKVPCRI